MTSQNQCVICDRPTPDGYACVADAVDRPRQLLAEIQDMLPAAVDVAHRQARHGTGGGASGKPGSALPLDLGATARLDGVQTALTTWARHASNERNRAVILGGPDTDDAITRAIRFLADQLEWFRHRPEVDEFLADVHKAHRIIRGIAEPGQHRVIVGLCDCGKTLYAVAGRPTVTCPDCELHWDVDDSRESLRGHLGDRLVTAAEAARLAAWLDTDRSAVQIRKLVNKWAQRGLLAKHGDIRIKHQHRDTCPNDCTQTADTIDTYRFGEIATRIAATPRRAQAAEMGA